MKGLYDAGWEDGWCPYCGDFGHAKIRLNSNRHGDTQVLCACQKAADAGIVPVTSMRDDRIWDERL